MAPEPLRVAVLVNTYASLHTSPIRDSFTSVIRTVSPTAEVEFFDPIESQIYPDVENGRYNLIVLSGGTEEPMGDKPWVTKEVAWIKETTKKWPLQKIMGICWGHQILCRTFGGKVEMMAEGAELGVTTIHLTDSGTKFFSTVSPSSELKVHEYHRRQITAPAKGFIPLASGNQSFLSASNAIISFQGHPEMNVELVKTMFAAVHSYMGVKESDKAEIEARMDLDHDGPMIWSRILDWAREEE